MSRSSAPAAAVEMAEMNAQPVAASAEKPEVSPPRTGAMRAPRKCEGGLMRTTLVALCGLPRFSVLVVRR